MGLILAQLAERQGNRFGFFVYSDRARCFFRAAVLQRLPRRSLFFRNPATLNFRELLTGIQLRLNRRSLLLFLISLDEALLMENVDLIRRQRLAAVIAIRP